MSERLDEITLIYEMGRVVFETTDAAPIQELLTDYVQFHKRRLAEVCLLSCFTPSSLLTLSL